MQPYLFENILIKIVHHAIVFVLHNTKKSIVL